MLELFNFEKPTLLALYTAVTIASYDFSYISNDELLWFCPQDAGNQSRRTKSGHGVIILKGDPIYGQKTRAMKMKGFSVSGSLGRERES